MPKLTKAQRKEVRGFLKQKTVKDEMKQRGYGKPFRLKTKQKIYNTLVSELWEKYNREQALRAEREATRKATQAEREAAARKQAMRDQQFEQLQRDIEQLQRREQVEERVRDELKDAGPKEFKIAERLIAQPALKEFLKIENVKLPKTRKQKYAMFLRLSEYEPELVRAAQLEHRMKGKLPQEKVFKQARNKLRSTLNDLVQVSDIGALFAMEEIGMGGTLKTAKVAGKEREIALLEGRETNKLRNAFQKLDKNGRSRFIYLLGEDAKTAKSKYISIKGTRVLLNRILDMSEKKNKRPEKLLEQAENFDNLELSLGTRRNPRANTAYEHAFVDVKKASVQRLNTVLRDMSEGSIHKEGYYKLAQRIVRADDVLQVSGLKPLKGKKAKLKEYTRTAKKKETYEEMYPGILGFDALRSRIERRGFSTKAVDIATRIYQKENQVKELVKLQNEYLEKSNMSDAAEKKLRDLLERGLTAGSKEAYNAAFKELTLVAKFERLPGDFWTLVGKNAKEAAGINTEIRGLRKELRLERTSTGTLMGLLDAEHKKLDKKLKKGTITQAELGELRAISPYSFKNINEAMKRKENLIERYMREDLTRQERHELSLLAGPTLIQELEALKKKI